MRKPSLGRTRPSIEDAEKKGIDIGMIPILSAHVMIARESGIKDWREVMSAVLTNLSIDKVGRRR